MEDYDAQVSMSGHHNGVEPPDLTLLEPRPFRPFKSSEEYLYAMREDLAEWLNGLYEGLELDADNFLEQMETGVILCQHANNVVRKAREYYRSGQVILTDLFPVLERDVVCRRDVLPETFHARDNVSNFIAFCRRLAVKECLLFETDDLVLRKNERSFILCLLEVARRGCQFGMPAPLLVQMEQEIDAEIANDDDGYDTLHLRQPQVVTNDLRSLHQRVVELLSRCTCPSQFPMIRVADGKYRIGDTKVLIFVRILRTHVMVRVGGGWDTLEHYLDKHDPCRCRSGHRLALSAKLTMMQGKSAIPSMHVTYNRPTNAPSSNPPSPQSQRRVLSHMSPGTSRRFRQSSPPGPLRTLLPPLPCSDDSSTSSLQERVPADRGRLTSSEDDMSDEEVGYHRKPRRRVLDRKELMFKDTVPSSWRYSPGIPRREPFHQQTIGQPRRGVDPGSRLPALSPRTEGKQPPKVGKVSPRPHNQPWTEPRSQSSEDLSQLPSSGPVLTKGLVFHSRGPSPVSLKGRAPLETPGFRRNDPKRHSSPRIYQRSSADIKMRLSPPKLLTPQENGRHLNGQQESRSASRRMFWSPERQPPRRQDPEVLRRRSSDSRSPDKSAFHSLPVLEKLQQHEDLCANQDFLLKIEQLISDFRAQTRLQDDGESLQYASLPANLGQEKLSPLRKSPVENGKSPSKIPLPTWYPKCPS